MRYLIIIEREISCGDAYGSEVRAFRAHCEPDKLEAHFKRWMNDWFNETNCGPDEYTTFSILHAVEIIQELPEEGITNHINSAIKIYKEAAAARKVAENEAAAQRKREHDLAQLAKLKEQYPDA